MGSRANIPNKIFDKGIEARHETRAICMEMNAVTPKGINVREVKVLSVLSDIKLFRI